MDFLIRFSITRQYLPTPTARRRGYPMSPGVRFIVAHDTGNQNTTAAQNVSYFTRTANPSGGDISSAHFFVDATQIIECIPVFDPASPPEMAWHVRPTEQDSNRLFGYRANAAAIGIEYCYGTAINADEAYRRYVWLIAYACYRFALDPATAVVGHFMLDPHRRTDPVTGLAHSRRNYEQLLRDVVAEYAECSGQAPPAGHAVSHHEAAGSVRATVRLHIRLGQPSTMAPICGIAEVGDILDYVAIARDAYPVNGNRSWYRNKNGNYFWSGGTAALVPGH